MVATNVTGETFWLSTNLLSSVPDDDEEHNTNLFISAPVENKELNIDLFRSILFEDKEIILNRIQKVINLNGSNYDAEEIEIAIDKVQGVRYVQQLIDVVKFIDANAPDELATQARPFLDELNKRLTPFEFFGFPPLSVSLPEDETMLLEWDFEHFTIGISFEPDPENSGWYIVNDGRIKSTTAWGYLNSKPTSEITKQFIDEALGGLSAPAS